MDSDTVIIMMKIMMIGVSDYDNHDDENYDDNRKGI